MTVAADLRGVRVLVVEDDYYLASDLQDALQRAGATVLGPFPDEEEARSALEAAAPDCAFVDINLGRGPSFGLSRDLLGRRIPFAFVTGYDAGAIPAEFDGVERCEKPMALSHIAAIAARLVGGKVSPR